MNVFYAVVVVGFVIAFSNMNRKSKRSSTDLEIMRPFVSSTSKDQGTNFLHSVYYTGKYIQNVCLTT